MFAVLTFGIFRATVLVRAATLQRVWAVAELSWLYAGNSSAVVYNRYWGLDPLATEPFSGRRRVATSLFSAAAPARASALESSAGALSWLLIAAVGEPLRVSSSPSPPPRQNCGALSGNVAACLLVSAIERCSVSCLLVRRWSLVAPTEAPRQQRCCAACARSSSSPYSAAPGSGRWQQQPKTRRYNSR